MAILDSISQGARCSSVLECADRSLTVDRLSYFLFQPVLHDWCNKGHGMWDGAYKRTLAANQKE